jgi:hypothetical protein
VLEPNDSNGSKILGSSGLAVSEGKNFSCDVPIRRTITVDYPYGRSNVDSEFHPIFERLEAEFGEGYKIYVRVEDFGRRISAGIVNTSNLVAATIPLKQGLKNIRVEVTSGEIEKIRAHLTSNEADDLAL